MINQLHSTDGLITTQQKDNNNGESNLPFIKQLTMKSTKLNKSEIKFYNQLLFQHLTEQDLTKQQIKKQFNKLKK